MALIRTDCEVTFTCCGIRLDYGERCLLTCGIGVEHRRPVRRSPSELDRGGAAKISEAHAGRIRPFGPRFLRQELAFKRESILKRGSPPGPHGGRGFKGRPGA